MAPTVFAGVERGMTIEREEILGPVLTLIPYTTVDEAVEIAARIPSASVTGIEVRPVWELRSHAPRGGRE